MQSHLLHYLDELAARAWREGRPLFSDFLSESDSLEAAARLKDFAYAEMALFGGTEGAARRIVRMGGEAPFPVSTLKIVPRHPKFAQPYTHRDVLGALLGLGLDRSVFGDIVTGEEAAYCFCLTGIAPFICENLKKVGGTDVSCTVTEERVTHSAVWKEITEQVSSLRCDVLVAARFRLSREEALSCFRSERVTLNGRPCSENAKQLKEGDTVSVRGKGKFTLKELDGTTRKGKYRIVLQIPEH